MAVDIIDALSEGYPLRRLAEVSGVPIEDLRHKVIYSQFNVPQRLAAEKDIRSWKYDLCTAKRQARLPG